MNIAIYFGENMSPKNCEAVMNNIHKTEVARRLFKICPSITVPLGLTNYYHKVYELLSNQENNTILSIFNGTCFNTTTINILEALDKIKSLYTISLNFDSTLDESRREESLKSILNFIQNTNLTIRELKLSPYSKLTSSNVKKIMETLQTNSTLKFLHLEVLLDNFNSITRELQKFIINHPSLISVTLISNDRKREETIRKFESLPSEAVTAVQSNNIQLLDKLLTKGKLFSGPISIHSVNNRGLTLLHLAATEGNIPMIDYLIGKGLSVNQPQSHPDYHTVLTYSIQDGYSLEIIKHLVDKGADVNLEDRYYSPLIYAMSYNRVDVIEYLLSLPQLVINPKPRFYALVNNYYDVLLQVVHRSEFNLHYRDENNCSLVFSAAIKNDLNVIKLYHQLGLNLNDLNAYGQSPLHYAAAFANHLTAQYLIDNGADVNQVDIDGCTPLHCAAYHSSIAVAEVLINHGANLNCVNLRGNTPANIALSQNDKNSHLVTINQNNSNNCDNSLLLERINHIEGENKLLLKEKEVLKYKKEILKLKNQKLKQRVESLEFQLENLQRKLNQLDHKENSDVSNNWHEYDDDDG
jgi:ankyrin repeat protein